MMRKQKRSRKALRGMEGITVWVHEISEDAANDGLSRQHLQDEVIVRILDSGIKALGIGNVPEPPGNPWLNIFINTFKLEENQYRFVVTVRLDEIVRPERNKAIKTVGTTWETEQNGDSSKEDLPMAVEKAMDNLVDYFIYDYLIENQQN